MSILEFASTTLNWSGSGGTAVQVIENLSIRIAAGEFVALMGPNGCGKSTILRLATGILRPTSGQVLWKGTEITGASIERAFLPQRPMLLEWLPVYENVAFGPKMRGVGRDDRRQMAIDILGRFGLESWWDKFPAQLSGGMRSRVALAMTLANNPELICLDESFNALDFQTRLVAQQTLFDIWQARQPSIILVTHDISEALLADRILVLTGRPGKVIVDRHVEHNGARNDADEVSRKVVGTALRAAAREAFEKERGRPFVNHN